MVHIKNKSLKNKKQQIKTRRHYFMFNRLAEVKKSGKTKCGPECGTTDILRNFS